MTTLTANLTWSAVTVNTDGTPVVPPVTYNLYQGPSATSLLKVQFGLTAPSATVTAGLAIGTTQFFAVSAVADGVESALSAPVSIAIPIPTPAAPTGLTVTLTG